MKIIQNLFQSTPNYDTKYVGVRTVRNVGYQGYPCRVRYVQYRPAHNHIVSFAKQGMDQLFATNNKNGLICLP